MDTENLTAELKMEIDRRFRTDNQLPLSSDITPEEIREFLQSHLDLQEPAWSNKIKENSL